MDSRKDDLEALDLVVERYMRDVDRTLLRENLKLTYEQRLRKLVGLEAIAELQALGQEMKKNPESGRC